MKDSQLIQILRTCSKKEVRELKKWLASPAHNHREDVVLLFDYLLGQERLWDDKLLEKNRVFRKIFPNEHYDDARMRQTMYFLLQALESYLVFSVTDNNEVRAQLILAGTFRERRIVSAYSKAIDAAWQENEQAVFRSFDYWQNRFEIEQERYLFQEVREDKVDKLNLQRVADSFDTQFIVGKLRLGCLMLAQQSIYKTAYNFSFHEALLVFVKENKLEQEPAIGTYYYGFLLSRGKNEEDYWKLREVIYKSISLFPTQEARDILLMAINYCISTMNSGKDEFVREILDLYQLGFDGEYLVEDGQISKWDYYNVVALALKISDFSRAEFFIEKYKDYLEDQYKESFVSYCRAWIYFEKEQYDEVMNLLAIDFSELLFNMMAKSMLVRIYYEQGEYTVLESLIESYRTYLQRKDIVEYHRKSHSNFIRMTRKLLSMETKDKAKQAKFKNEIETTDPLFPNHRAWLLKQVE